MSREPLQGPQVDRFIADGADVPLRDQRAAMERPFFSLSTNKRIKPIDYASPDGSVSLRVSATAALGMATIRDADIPLRAASYISWNAPRAWAPEQAIDPVASHASWMESFSWTRLAGVAAPEGAKPPIDPAAIAGRHAASIRGLLGDGVFAGRHHRGDEEMEAIWRVAVEETRALLEHGW